MIKAFVSNITTNFETNTEEVVIILEDQRTYTLPIELLPKYVEVDDFLIIDHGKITIDPESDDKKELIRSHIENLMN